MENLCDIKYQEKVASNENDIKETPKFEGSKINNLLKKYSLDEIKRDTSIFNGEEYYIPKAIVIVSESPYFTEYQELLRELYHKSLNYTNYIYDHYLRYITFEVPKPGRGSIIKFISPTGNQIELK